MRLLLDTHVLVWALGEPERLPQGIARLIVDPRSEINYSVVSLFEIAIKRSSGRRGAPPVAAERASQLAEIAGYLRLDVTAAHAIAVESIAPFHPDPFDKLLLAQAKVEHLRLVTSDEQLASYDPTIIYF